VLTCSVDVGRVDVCDGYSVVVVSAAVDGALLWVEEGAADGPWSPCCWLAHAAATAARISHIAKALRLLHSESQTRALMALDGREPTIPVHNRPNCLSVASSDAFPRSLSHLSYEPPSHWATTSGRFQRRTSSG
jgi:hypothetical protein